MALPNACVLFQRRLWLQSIRRHYIAFAIEAIVTLGLCYLVVKACTPEKAVVKLTSKVVYDIATDPYDANIEVNGIIYGRENSVIEELVQAAFPKAKTLQRKNPNGTVGDVYNPVKNGADVFTTCHESNDQPACIRFADDFGRTGSVELNYELIGKSGQAIVPEKLPLERPHSFRLSNKLESGSTSMKVLLYHQARIEKAYLRMEKNKSGSQSPEYKVLLRQIPEEPPAEDVKNYRLYTINIYNQALTIPFMRRITAIANEIGSGMKDQQRINGLSPRHFWIGHFLVGFAIEMVYCSITIFFMFSLTGKGNLPFLRNVDITLLVAVMALFTVQHNLWAMLLAGVLPKGRYALTAGAFLGFLAPLLDRAFSRVDADSLNGLVLMDRFTKLRMTLFPQVAAEFVIRTMCIFDDFEGSAGWGSIARYALGVDQVAMVEIIAIMLGMCLLLVFLLFYLTNVLPWSTSLPEHPLFCLTPGYWIPGVTLRLGQGEEAPRNPTRFEELPDGQPVIEATNLVKKFGSFTALNGVSMKIYNSSVTVLLGHNGAGKTTLMTILTGLRSPTSGSLVIQTEQDGTSSKSISFCQQFDVLFEDLTVAEHLFYFGKLQGAPRAKLNETVGETLNVVKMVDKWGNFPSQLSGGMKRRLSLSIALVARPKVLILDEPTTGMDPETRRSIWELIGNLRERTTILLSTHDMEEAEVLADRIVFLCNGKVVCEGSPTFLKKACGVGYAINFNTKPGEFNAEETLDLVRETVPNAAIKDKKQGSLTIALHTTKHQGLATMFKKLEKEAGNLGIKSFGVSVATMADAYLIIDKDWAAEGAEANDLGASTSTEAAAPESAPAACTGLETRPATVQRVRALLAKRLLYFSRSPMTILMGCIVPTVLFTLYCLTVKGYVANFSGSLNSGKVKLQSSSHFPGAQCFIQDPLGTNFSRGFSALAKSEGLTMVPMTDAKSELLASARADFIKYYTLYPFGIVVNATTVEGWYNPASPVSRGVVLNLINTVLLRDYSGAPAARVNSVLGFFGSTAKEQEKIGDFLQFLSFLGPMFFWAFVPPALLGLTASTLVTFPVAEKLSGARELQLMTGVPGPLFIGTHFVFDFLLPYLVPFGACLTVYCFWYYDDLSFVTVAAIYVVMVVFAPIPILEAYLLSNFVESEGSAYSIILIAYVIGGPSAFLAKLLLMAWVKPHLLKAALMLLPSYSLTQTISNVVALNYAAELCHRLFPRGGNTIKEQDCSTAFGIISHVLEACCIERARNPNVPVLSPPGPFSLSMASALPDLAYLAAQGLLLFTFTYLLYQGLVRWPSGGITLAGGQEGGLDADVAAEMQLAQRFSSPSQAATMEGEGYALVACGLHKSYGSFTAVRGLSLALRSGECFGLLGVNGAGKSTTFQMLTGLLQPTGGDAFMKDACLSTNRTKWQSFIGYCPQASGLLDRLNAYECLWMYARLRGIPEAQIKAAVESAIELTDLEKHAHKNCGIYSGGNKRKLTIAVGILGNPRVVFLDEPYAGVDVVARTKIQRNMDRIRRNTNIPMVLTSHHMEDCEAACDRLCIMVAGQMTCLGTLQHLKDKFGKGYTMQLVLAPAARPSESGEGGPPAQMQGQELGAAVEKLFPGIKVLSAKDNVQDFHIRDVIPWSEIFRNIDKLEEKFTFSHVLVQDTNLEQLFIAFAQNKDTPQGA